MQDVQPSLDLLTEVYQQSKHLYEEAEVEEALDDIPEQSFQEAMTALLAAPPIKPEPQRLTRQSARRLAIQITWKRLSEPQVDGRKIPRYIRRRMMFNKAERLFNFSDLARGLRSLTDTES